MWSSSFKWNEILHSPKSTAIDSSATASWVGFTPGPFLDFQGFYVALRLVACAQSGHEVTLSNLNLNMPPPKFVSVRILHVHVPLVSVSLCFLSLFSYCINYSHNLKLTVLKWTIGWHFMHSQYCVTLPLSVLEHFHHPPKRKPCTH